MGELTFNYLLFGTLRTSMIKVKALGWVAVVVVFCVLWLGVSNFKDGETMNVTTLSLDSMPKVEAGRMDLLPHVLGRPLLELSIRDPFSIVAVPVLPVTAAAPVVLSASPMPPMPSVPPLGLSFAGRMIGPDGTQTIFVRLGNESAVLSLGSILANGYRVIAITPEAVEFNYQQHHGVVRLLLPAVPSQEIR